MENDVNFGKRVYSQVYATRPAQGRAQGALLWIVGPGKPGLAATGSDGPCPWCCRSANVGFRRPGGSADARNRSGEGAGPAKCMLSAMPYRVTGLHRTGASTTTSPTACHGRRSPAPCSCLIHIIPLVEAGFPRASRPNLSTTAWLSSSPEATHPSKPMRQRRIHRSPQLSSFATLLCPTPIRC